MKRRIEEYRKQFCSEHITLCDPLRFFSCMAMVMLRRFLEKIFPQEVFSLFTLLVVQVYRGMKKRWTNEPLVSVYKEKETEWKEGVIMKITSWMK